MSSRLIAIVFALLFSSIQSSAYSNEQPSGSKDSIADLIVNSNKEERLAHRMHKMGIRHFLGNEGVARLKPTAEQHAKKLNLCCEVSGYWEIHFQKGNSDTLAGYEITLDCSDAPTPGLAVYLDSSERFLGNFDFGH